MLIAAAIRWPLLQQVPRLTDETQDMQFAFKIARGVALPIISPDLYNGPLVHYFMALGFRLGGGLSWPRIMALVFGVLTVGLTYGLARSLCLLYLDSRGSTVVVPTIAALTEAVRTFPTPAPPVPISASPQLAALIAAGLMAVGFVPVVINSHIAWSNATTPFWTTAFLWMLAETVRRNRPALLLAVGLLAGLAQQTHPAALAILIGGGLWLAICRPNWLRTRWPWLALAVALAAVGNLIVFNLASSGGALAQASSERGYAFTGGSGWAEYAVNLRGFARLAYQSTGSTFLATLSEEADPEALRTTLLAPGALLYGLVALVAVAYCARRRQGALPAMCWLAAALVLPLFNRAYNHFIHARYVAALLPPTFAAVGVLAAQLWGPKPTPDRRGRKLIRVAVGIVAVVLLAYPLTRLDAFYRRELAEGRTNARLWQLEAALKRLGTDANPIRLDRELRNTRLTAGGNVLLALDALLDLNGTPHEKPRSGALPDLPTGAMVVLGDRTRDELSSRLALEAVDIGAPPEAAAPGSYWLYRVMGKK